MHWELQIKLYLRGMPNVYKEQKNFKRFIFYFGHLSIQSVASSISFGMIYSILISHVVCWFMVTDLEKLAISFRA